MGRGVVRNNSVRADSSFKCGRRYAILSLMTKLDSLPSLLLTMVDRLRDALKFIKASLRLRRASAAENLFLHKQLALYLERKVKPRRARGHADSTSWIA